MAIKLIAFDWNGTLLADTIAHGEISSKTLEAFGYGPITLKQFRDTFHVPIYKFYEANGCPKENFEKFAVKQWDFFYKLYEKRVAKVRSRNGVRPALEWLDKNNINAIIYSNHVVTDIERQLKRLGLKKLITKTLARTPADIHSHLHDRTKEQKLHAFVKIEHYKPKEVISIGDTEEELEIGKKLGFYTVGITGGFNTTARLKKHHPDFLIHNMKDLIGIIKKLNGK